jgi:endonuclease-3
MLRLTPEQIEQAIYPVGFYRTKARTLLDISRILVDEYGGRVPDDIDTLLTLPGVGRKTANLVVTAGYGKPGICVDTHVHRITNRWGYVSTRSPDETEMALRAKLPPEYWLEINTLLVALGQNICHPTSPRCSICPVQTWCDRVGVTRSR